MNSPWDAYKPPTFGQGHQGEAVSNMEIKTKATSSEGLSMKLECPKCQNQFWAQLWKGGQHAVIRNGDQIHAQCSGCGAEWNGESVRFFAVAVTQQMGLSNTNAVGLGVVATLQASDPLDVTVKIIRDNLIPEQIRSGQETYRGITITEITELEHKILLIKQRAREAAMSKDPDADSVFEKCIKEEAELLGGKPSPFSETPPDGSPNFEKLLDIMKKLAEFKQGQMPRE